MKKNKPEIETLITGLQFPESPVFAQDGRLWFVEIEGGCLSCWDGNSLKRFDVDGTPNGATIDKSGDIWFCDSRRGEIRKFYVQANKFETVCSTTTKGERLICPNDLIFDAAGNLLFSDHANGRKEARSRIYVLPKDSVAAITISENKLFTNGLALSKDGQTLIFAETYNQLLWTGDWDAEKLIFSNEKPFAKVGNGMWGPDGMAFDEHENLYVAIFDEYSLAVFDKAGKLLETIRCEGRRPTSCTFDPSGKLGLVVTEAERGEIIYRTENREDF